MCSSQTVEGTVMTATRIEPQQWREIEALLPKPRGRRGRPWRDHKQVIEGILWKLETGAPWRDLPRQYGPWQTAYDRFTRWGRDGTWDRIMAVLERTEPAAAPCAPVLRPFELRRPVHTGHAPSPHRRRLGA